MRRQKVSQEPDNKSKEKENEMDKSKLASRMLAWERAKVLLDTLTVEIETAVLEIGATQTVGNVRASYSGGRRSFDYREAADGHPMVGEATVALFTTVVPETKKIDWRGICEHAGIEDVLFTKSAPRVTVKLLK